MLSSLKRSAPIFLSLLLSACATYNLQVKDDQSVESPDSDIEHSFYLIGDAGNSELGERTEAIKDFEQALNNAKKNSTAIFLGDNIYPSGLPKEGSERRTLAQHRLQVQVDAVKNFKGEAIFIPGNHDWYSGIDGLKRQERFIEAALGKNTFLPERGCPIEKVDVSDDIVLIIVDSQWYITNWDKHPKINDNCEFKTRSRFIDEFESLIKKSRGKTTIVAIHNPMFTNGPHGGQYSFGSHMTPIPFLGTLKNIIRKTGGVSHADQQNVRYRELKDRLVTLAQENDKVIFVSGHEHSLQYIVESNIPQIVSGSGSKTSPTRNVGGGKFAYGSQGYAVLDVYKDGSSQVRFYSAEDDQWVYTTQVLKANKSNEVDYPSSGFADRVDASIYSASETDKSDFYKKLWGERYRKYFSTPVNIPTESLDTLYGGLKPVRKGGGHQSKSLRLEDAQGRQYVMRALRKNAVQYLQAVVFKDQYVTEEFKGTDTEALLLDAFTASHPYAPFTIADLSKAVDVYYTQPRLFYVPKQRAIGKYNDEFGDEIYMIEERASDGHSDKAGFGYSDKLISTYDMLEKIREDEDHMVDESAYIRARLFDMVIGDWDRHQDQWRWAVFKEDGKTIYRPVPRDRDQAFSLMDDGALMKTATFLIPPLRLLRSYGSELRDPKWFNVEPYPLDVALLTKSTKADWDNEVKTIQNNLTESVIDNAFLNFPEEVRDQTISEIKQKLLGRKANLQEISDEYFDIVNKYATVRGTDKDDWFEIERLENGLTSVKVYRIIKGEKKDLFHERIYKPSENKEIWVFGLDDDDYFEVKGNGKGTIAVRLVGGQNKDTYNVINSRGVHIYDYKTKESIFESNKGHRHLKDDYYTNIYDFKKVRYNSRVILPSIGFNPDDGLKVGIGGMFRKNGYDGERFTSLHSVNAQVYFATGGFDVNYKGEFAELFNNINLGLNASFSSPNFAVNFFGFGNSTPNLNTDPETDMDEESLDYNRVRKSVYSVGPSLIKYGEYGSRVSLSVNYQSIEIENTQDRFINEFFQTNAQPDRDEFITTEFNYSFNNADNDAFPSLGFSFDLALGYVTNINNSNDYSYVVPSIGFDYKLDATGNVVLASHAQGQFNFGDEFEFYQAANIGGNRGLRGYRNERFSGKRAFYQSTDLRYKLKRVKTSVLPLEYGVYGGFDYGRVWVDDDLVSDPDFNEDRLNTSVGGGLFVNMVDMLSLNLGAFTSKDNLRIAFAFGFTF